MKRKLLEFLVCPVCKADLESQVSSEQSGEILSGNLLCRNAHAFEVLNGVPRFVTSDEYTKSFGFQWNKFSTVQLDVFNHTKESEQTLAEKTGFSLSDLKGKFILDAGTGAGRFADVASRYEAEVVGIDLSSAVDAAYKNIGDRPNVHLIQADIFHLPFKDAIFDRIFSIGVLHHTPDTRKAFQALVPLLKENGEIAIWVYDCYTPFKKITDTVRIMTSRLPRKAVLYGSTIAVPLYYLKPFRTIFQGVFRLCMHRNARWRWLDTFDYFSPKFQWKHTYAEVYSWFEEAGLKTITPLSAPVSMKGRKEAQGVIHDRGRISE